MVETLAELPFIGDQVVCLSHDQAGPPGNDCVAIASEHGFALWAARGRILQGWADAQKGEATTGIARIRDGMAAEEATGGLLSAPFLPRPAGDHHCLHHRRLRMRSAAGGLVVA